MSEPAASKKPRSALRPPSASLSPEISSSSAFAAPGKKRVSFGDAAAAPGIGEASSSSTYSAPRAPTPPPTEGPRKLPKPPAPPPNDAQALFGRPAAAPQARRNSAASQSGVAQPAGALSSAAVKKDSAPTTASASLKRSADSASSADRPAEAPSLKRAKASSSETEAAHPPQPSSSSAMDPTTIKLNSGAGVGVATTAKSGAANEQVGKPPVGLGIDGGAAGLSIASSAPATGIASASSVKQEASRPSKSHDDELPLLDAGPYGQSGMLMLNGAQHPRTSQIPPNWRISSLEALQKAFAAIYSCPGASPAARAALKLLADLDARAQEAEVFKLATRHSYKTSVRLPLVSLGKRAKDTATQAAIAAAVQRAEDGATAQQLQSVASSSVQALARQLRDAPQFGTAKELETKTKRIEERERGTLSAARLEAVSFLAPVEKLGTYGYSLPQQLQPDLQAAVYKEWGNGGDADPLGSTHLCNRCSQSFEVSDVHEDLLRAEEALALCRTEGIEGQVLLDAELEHKEMKRRATACSFHWGRKSYERDTINGRSARQQRYACCGAVESGGSSLASTAAAAGFSGSSARAEQGCDSGPHVWKSDDAKVLHELVPFRSPQSLRDEKPQSEWKETQEIVALDAELVYTTAGMSIARITLVDEAGAELYDKLIAPGFAVLDLNTRFSGIQPGQLDPENLLAVPLAEAQAEIVRFVGPETILVGHGLENDLRALRLVHTRIVDSALLFPHGRGLPFRMSLRELAKRHLGLTIQTAGADGHSSLEDARIALDVVRWKFVNDPASSPFRSSVAAGPLKSPALGGPTACPEAPAAPAASAASVLPARPPAPAPRPFPSSVPAAPTLFVPRRSKPAGR